ncbi:MAG: glycoside hydrolase family 99-like domain-containing protein [Bacteroidota bacterium]
MQADKKNNVTVACYYFPNYHPSDARNQKLKGEGWSEWKLVKEAKPRFESHHQPNVPLWDYTDESDPKQMAQKIEAASSHGIDAFIFDWYWYNDGPFLERALDEGFLNAPNNDRLKFSLMWANHDWVDIHPYTKGKEAKLLYPGAITKETFNQVCEHVIDKYFLHPSYWKIEGKPYFSFYDLNKLMESFGSIEATRKALDEFRDKAKLAGLPDIHLNAVVWGSPILPGEVTQADPADIVKRLGFDSVTSYVWIHHVQLPEMKTDFKYVQDEYFKYWSEAEKMFNVPYYPNVTMGWDSSPRALQEQSFDNSGYPFMHTISGNTPERFKQALLAAKQRLEKDMGPKILNINCWNEWTEGSYLEPDTRNGMAYLEAIKNIFEETP